MKINVTVEGLTPLLINRFHEEIGENIDLGFKSRKEDETPLEVATKKLYANGHGTFFPAENIRQSMIGAASRFKIGRRAATTDIAAAVYVSPFEIPLEQEWHVDSRAIVNPTTKGRRLGHRPMFDDWSLSFQIEIDTDLVPEKLARSVLESAGKLVGVGDFRPARKGPYGRFSVTSWERAN